MTPPVTPAGAPPPAGQRTRDRLLALFKQHGPLSAGDLSTHLGLTEPAVRRHLAALSDLGLIEGRTERPSGRGRPQQVYSLTDLGESQFPKAYPSLCLEILQHLSLEYGTQAVDRVLRSRAEAVAAQVRQAWPAQGTLAQRVDWLRGGMDHLGYDTDCTEDSEFFYLTHRNCPHLVVAREFGEVCASELDMLTDLLERPVIRESRLACGQGCCRYRIAKEAGKSGEEGGRTP